ncbi:hypothetical protein HY095_05925 [Candidatus Micrarchaeota archaeon]|nr:hypothetical protein [Candidatus Micrarchaeota archaeon]
MDNPHGIRLLDLNDLANSLMLEQTSKGVGAMLALPGSMENALSKALQPFYSLTTLPDAINRLSQKIGQLPSAKKD